MGPGDVFSLLIVVSIPTLLIFYLAKRYFTLKEKKLEIEALNAAEKAAQYVARSSEIEARLAVIERIVTDQPGRLAREIEQLQVGTTN